MPTSPDGILEATFDPAWATVRLVVDGGMWPSPVDTITIVRQSPGGASMGVRGVESRRVVSGFFVGSDPEAPLGTVVTYRVDGHLGAALVAQATVTVETTGAECGLWVKVPGLPDLTVRVPLRGVSEISSPTTGGVYEIAGGGGTVTQTTAQWSGIGTDRGVVSVSPRVGVELARLRAALAAGRVLLLQPVGSDEGTPDLDAGWYFVSNVARANPGGFDAFGFRIVEMSVQRTTVPAGDGQGVPGVTWAAVKAAYPTWTALLAAKPAWFDVMKGV